MKKFIYLCFFFFLVSIQNSILSQIIPKKIDLAFCIDLSGSTNGIIHPLRDKMWDIINDFLNYSPRPDVRIAMVVYGRPTFGKKNHYVKVLSDFTHDYDTIIYELYKLREKVEEGLTLVGYAIATAVTELNWFADTDDNVIKTIIIVGNGSPNNGDFKYKEASKLAQKKNIRISSIYLKTFNNPEHEVLWTDMAKINNGEFRTIGLQEPNIVFYKNYDNELFLKSAYMLNETYIYYGPKGNRRFNMLKDLDSIAKSKGTMCYESRAMFMASEMYQKQNSSWDLVDFYSLHNCLPSNIEPSFLPEIVNKLKPNQIVGFIEAKKFERGILVEVINTLTKERRRYVNREIEKLSKFNVTKTLSLAVIEILRKQASERGFVIETK